jgi:hypothetical protein
MIVVAVVALALGLVAGLERRRELFRRRADDYALQEAWAKDRADICERLAPRWWRYAREGRRDLDWIHGVDSQTLAEHQAMDINVIRASYEKTARRCEAKAVVARARISYAALLRLKYEYAAAHPWLPVEPDPPEPK